FDPPACFLHGGRRSVDVLRILQPEAEVRDAARLPRFLRVPLEDQDVAGAGRLQLDERVASIDLHRTEDTLVEARCPRDVLDRDRDVRQPVGLDHLRWRTRYSKKTAPAVATTS